MEPLPTQQQRDATTLQMLSTMPCSLLASELTIKTLISGLLRTLGDRIGEIRDILTWLEERICVVLLPVLHSQVCGGDLFCSEILKLFKLKLK